MNITDLHKSQQAFFKKGISKDVSYRLEALKKLRTLILNKEQDILKALHADLGKSNFEAYATEYYVIIKELNTFIKNTASWSKPRHVMPSLINFPSTDKRIPEPYGNVLIISPWNYPFQLALGPLIAAVATGNTVTLKPSEFTTHTAQLLSELIQASFEPEHVTVALGDSSVAQELTSLKWNYIFFTGSPPVGKKIYEAAAKHLTPVTLELGGKNPCVIHQSAKIDQSAKRIVWGKFLNCGQTCIAPDYILVHHTIKDAFVQALIKHIKAFYGNQIATNPDYGKIIRDEHFDKLLTMLEGETILHGGNHDKSALFIEPTLIDNPSRDSAIMEGEIFGPLLPIISYDHKDDISQWIDSYDKPLSGYLFTTDNTFKNWFTGTFSYGGGVINDSIIQFINDRLPFGGVGNSGIGSYHGKNSFETFSHLKSVVHRGTWIDIPMRYAPYGKKYKMFRKILKFIS